MTKAAVIGTFWTSKKQAEADARKKTENSKKNFLIIEHKNGYLVLSEPQITNK